MAGKGDNQRPVDYKRFGNNFDDIKWKSKEVEEDEDDSNDSSGAKTKHGDGTQLR